MKIQLLNENAQLPKKSHLPDSGFDIFLPETFTIRPFETMTVGLGIAVSVPEGFAGILVPRSSIAQKGLIIQTSIIDPDYTGEIHLIITNCSPQKYTLEKGQRVCSICCFNVLNPYVEIVEEFPTTERGSDGLGSSGLWCQS